MTKTKLVSAPAGSGKTTRLVREYLSLLDRYDADRIVTITFTRRAAAELVDRVSTVLRAVAGVEPMEPAKLAVYADVVPKDLARVHDAITKIAGAPIGTVDAFVHALLRENVLEAFVDLPGGARVWLDGVEFGGDTSDAYLLAARDVLDDGSAEAELVLSRATVGEASGDLARIARCVHPERPSARALLGAIAERLCDAIEREPSLWSDLPTSAVNSTAAHLHARVAAWLRDRRGPAPAALLPWLADLAKARGGDERRAARDEVVAAAVAALGVPKPSGFWRIDPAFSEATALDDADALANAYIVLGARARARALEALAASGGLGFDEMLLAATATCRARPAALRDRYDALLVDEVQDTSRAQLDFYRAFGAMRDDTDRPIPRFFVGDVRQSIYRFRGADPHGWNVLLADVGDAERIVTNRRSNGELVDVQRRVFSRLEAHGLASIDELAASRGAAGGEPPVHVVDGAKDEDPDRLAVAHFATRLKERWKTHPSERAAVLASSWRTARLASEWLRAADVRAQLIGDRALLSSRVAADLRITISALLDPTDDVAMLGLLKHPAVGVPDGGILALRADGALGLSYPFRPGFDAMRVPAAARDALVRAAPALREARGTIGRLPTADVLERMIAKLDWRPILAAGPEGQDGEAVAQLDVLLECIRQVEGASGTDPFRVLAELEPTELRLEDLPPVRLRPGGQMVEVTTVHAAKGLEWEHVALVKVAADGGAAIQEGRGTRILAFEGRTFLGVKLDPTGGLSTAHDPVAALLGALDASEQRRERTRLFYVAFTRARETVTFGIEHAGQGTFSTTLREIFTEPDEHVRVLRSSEIAVVDPVRELRPATRWGRPFEAKWREPSGAHVAQPSSLAARLGTAERRSIVERSLAAVTFCAGAVAPDAPAALHALDDRAAGHLVHGWLERWQFSGDPSVDEARAYLRERWGMTDARGEAIATWLADAGRILRDTLPGFAALIDGARLHFEWPLVGVVDEDVILTGRTDLVVEKDDALVVIDFKAGRNVATGATREAIPSFSEYAVQLDAYRRVYEASGRRVAEVGLVYVRAPSWVRIACR